MLFGNMLNLDRGIFVNIPDRKSAIPLSKHMNSLLSIQDNLLQASAKELLRTDEIHMKDTERFWIRRCPDMDPSVPGTVTY